MTEQSKPQHSKETVVHVNDVDLCVQTFGDAGDPPILLIGGAAASMDWWEDDFCTQLAAGSRFVLRYDNRDTGRSTSYPAGSPTYSGLDLADDALALLDAHDLTDAHIVGISMGGGIAQRLAVEHPDRVATLVLMSTSPGGPGGPDNPDLPPMSEAMKAVFADPAPEPDWSDRRAVIDYMVEGQRPFEGTHPFDEASLRVLVGRVFDRTKDIAATNTNHWILEGGDPVRSRLGEVGAPTLVLHGTADPLFPIGHGKALADEIPGAVLMPLDGVGHQVPPRPTWEYVIPAILRHTSGGWEAQADRLAARSLASGDPSGWFDQLYRTAATGAVDMPWNRERPHPLLSEWAREDRIEGSGRSAIVVGAGLGADAEFVARLGFQTLAFDVSATAVDIARQRYPESRVDYVHADLLALPSDWARQFDLVIEIFTVQALPRSHRQDAIANVARLVAPGGSLVVIAAMARRPVAADDGPPWPLTREELESFATDGLTREVIEEASHPDQPGERRWRAVFRRAD